MRLLGSAILLFVAGSALGACQGLVGIEDSPPLKADASAGAGGAAGSGAQAGSGGQAAAGAGGVAGAAGAADAGCKSAQPPPATAGADPGGNIEFVVAIRQVDLGDTEAGGPTWPKIGYDLDKLCTCDTDTAGSCKPPKKLVCDGLDGRDNSMGAFLYQIKNTFMIGDLSSEKLTTRIEAGSNTVLIRVRGYNGTANDALVEVSWFASDDFDITNTNPPKWDGNDAWPVLSSSLVPGIDAGSDAGADSGSDASSEAGADGGSVYNVENARYVDKVAYVANGTLVANLPEGAFSLTSYTAINFAAALFTATIESAPSGGWALKDGVLSGITKVTEVLTILPSIDDPLSGKPICTDNIIYAGVKNLICDYPDMSILGTPAKPCDYLSLGVSVQGSPAKLGAVSVKPIKPSPCSPGTDPSGDSC